MTAYDRNELIVTLIYNYVSIKKQDKVWEREHGSEYYTNLGKLLGCLTAFELDMEEDDRYITIKTQGKGKVVLRYDTEQ